MQLFLHADLQCPLHPCVQYTSHAFRQFAQQVPAHDPLEQVDGACERARIGTCANTIAPITGNAVFAADLKNSRRDCKSSFFLSSITL